MQQLEVAVISFLIVMGLFWAFRIAVHALFPPRRRDRYWVDFWGRRHYFDD